MNELTAMDNRLPTAIEDLSKYALFGRDRLVAAKAEIQAIKKAGLAKEVYDQKLHEAQEIAELVTLAEMQIGALMKEIRQASGGDRRSEDFKNRDESNFDKPKTKTEIVKELGFSKDQASQFQQMADNEDLVKEAIAEAKENDDIVSRSDVMRKIKARRNNGSSSKKSISELIFSDKDDGGSSSEIIPYEELTVKTEDIIADMYDPDSVPEFTIDMLVECIKGNAQSFTDMLGMILQERKVLITDETRERIENTIDKYVIEKTIKIIKELVNK